MTAKLESSCLLLIACAMQMALLVALFSVNSNADTDTYFLYRTDVSGDVVKQLNDIMNQTHARGWPGPTLPVATDFMIMPMFLALAGVLMFGLLTQFWTYRMATVADVWMESYTPDVLAEHGQWDALFVFYVGVQHAAMFILLCSPATYTFVILMTVFVLLVVIERCAPRPEDARGAERNGFAMVSLLAAAYVGLRVLYEQKRHVHSAGVFYVLQVLLDMALVFGHSWDARTHQFATVINCRSFFIAASSILLFSVFVTHCAHIAGRDSVAVIVSDIYKQ